jgi:hypothetical protein
MNASGISAVMRSEFNSENALLARDFRKDFAGFSAFFIWIK